MSIEERVARLEAAEAVRRTFNRYLWFLDGGLTDDLLAVFAEDVSMQATNYPPGTGGMLEFEGRDALAALYGPIKGGRTRHNSTNVSVAVADDARTASLTAYFLTAFPDGIQGGVYEGTLRATTDDPAGPWEIVTWRVSSQWGWHAKAAFETYSNPPGAFTLGGGRPAGS